MQHQTSSLRSRDGLGLFNQAWLPDHPKAVVIISHGYAEHSSRYRHVAARLSEAGYAVYALDHRNHGQSGGERGYVADFSAMIDDLDQVVDKARAEHPELPTYVLGHSMGGALAARYALRHQDKLAGLVLSAAYLENAVEVPAYQERLLPLLSKLLPKIPVLKLAAEDVSRDPVVVRAYEDDPLNYRGKVGVRTAAELASSGPEVYARMDELRLPLLILHGSGDKLAAMSGSERLYRGAGADDKTLKTYEGLYHELLNEPEQDEVMADILSWLDARLGGAADA